MQIPLNHFEQYIDETILKRGLSYFKNGNVGEPEEITTGEFESIVKGTDDYTVRLKIKNGLIIEHDCDCPYDLGPVCKHVVSVIFYLQQDELNLKKKSSTSKTTKSKEKIKRKTVAEQVNDVIDRISHDELKQFIKDKTSENTQFRNLFLSSFVQHNTNESKELYSKQVKSILRTGQDRHGFIDWSASRFVGNAVTNLVNSAQKQFEKKNYKTAIFICTAVMEQMTEALQFSDDSNGDIGGNIDFAHEILTNIANENISEEIRKQIFDYCLTSFEKKIYSGWDWHVDMLRLATKVSHNNEEVEQILEYVDKPSKSEFERDQLQRLKYDLLIKSKGEQQAEKYLEQNITNSDLREETIRKAIRNKNYLKAIFIARDGVNYDKKDKPGLVWKWYDWLLKIAQLQKDKEKIIEYARVLFISNFRHEQDYYKILKDTTEPEKWTLTVESIIKEITTQKKWPDTSLIASIYIAEEWWDRLLVLVKNSPTLNTIEYYEKYLSSNYSIEVTNLYAIAILDYMKNNVSRNHYQTACRYLRRMIKLGAREKANQVTEELRTKYPQRKALIEELNKV